MLTQAEINAIADAVAARLQPKPAAVGDWLTREQVETYLNISRTAFFTLRKEHPLALAPACKHPLRWSRKALDVFMLVRAPVQFPVRRGRKRAAPVPL